MKNLDQVILVTEDDQPIGSMDKVEAHRGQGKLHRAISVYLFRKDSQNLEQLQLLVQQRSAKKIVGAGQWANTVCGNVRPEESYQECALRRLKEELGITTAQIKPLYKFRYQVACNDEFSENEIDQVFIGWYDGKIDPNLDEVQTTDWVDWPEILDERKGQHYLDKILAPWFLIMLEDKQLADKTRSFFKE